jgi:hypothetical protein
MKMARRPARIINALRTMDHVTVFFAVPKIAVVAALIDVTPSKMFLLLLFSARAICCGPGLSLRLQPATLASKGRNH